MLAVVLLAAFVVTRTCGSTEPGVTQEEAVEIAKEQVDFEPTNVQIRNVPRGLEGRRSWAVSLYTGPVNDPGACRLVEIDAEDGTVRGIARC